MGDINRKGDTEVNVVNKITQAVLAVTSNGDDPVDLLRVGGTALTLGQKVMASSIPVVMSSDQSPIPVTQAPALLPNVFSVVAESTGQGTAETNRLLLRNPGGSGKTIQLSNAWLSNFHTVQSGVRFRFYSNPTVTAAGATLTIPRSNIGGVANSIATAHATPTTSAFGAKMIAVGVPSIENGGTVVFDLRFYTSILPGNDLLITAQAGGTNRQPSISLQWAEV